MKKEQKPMPKAINFNQHLNLKHLETIYIFNDQRKNIDDPQLIKPISCYFNFKDDQLEFMLDVRNDESKDIMVNTASVCYFFLKRNPVSIPVNISQEMIGNKPTKVTIYANFKDCLLHLFDAGYKQFLLMILYSTADHKYASLYSASPPVFLKSGWKPKKLHLKDYYPSNFCGMDLQILFNKDFGNHPTITSSELELLNKIQDYKAASFEDRFNQFDFLAMFQYMVAIEDLEATNKMKDQSSDFARIFDFKSCPRFLKNKIQPWVDMNMEDDKIYSRKIHIIQVKKKLFGDDIDFKSVHFYEQQDFQENENDHRKLVELRIIGEIDFIIDNLVIVKIHRPEKPKKLPKIKLAKTGSYHVDFLPNRACFRVAQRALEDMKNMKVQSYLQNFETKNVLYRGSKEKFKELNWLSPSIKTNEEQMLAVKNIVNCTSFPSPFIIFGGPGTGKSTIIVEAIAQIVKMKADSRVLFTAGSNSTCDDIGNRLAKYVSVNKILRIYSPSFEKKEDKIDEFLRELSNFRKTGDSKKIDPSVEEFLTARVIIVTLVSVGRLINANFLTNHFDYIFIDEAGFVSEPESYIPLVGLGLSKKGRVHAQVVLAGDHKQLSPVITNILAKDLGLEVSLMERLMDNDPKYKFSEKGYNHNFVVQLKQNYRNHPAIMRFSNENFYDSQLVSMRTDRLKHLLITNEEFPIIFHDNKSSSEMVGKSLKNEGELKILKLYVNILLKVTDDNNNVEESDIGIISPYRGQRDKIIKMFSKKFPNIEIGTVDSFQGSEKKIVLVSCVRSGTSHVGFLSNEKRLNVALTRSKSLLIIIGNAATLQKSNIWHKFITYCHENKATVGDLKGFDHEKFINEDELSEDEDTDEYKT